MTTHRYFPEVRDAVRKEYDFRYQRWLNSEHAKPLAQHLRERGWSEARVNEALYGTEEEGA